MHVRTTTALSISEIESRFARVTPSESQISYSAERMPPKFFVKRSPLMPPPAAEVKIADAEAGSEVTLRLMWGGLPAPFPRVLALCMLVAAAIILVLGSAHSIAVILGLVLLAIAVAGFAYQRAGERYLQQQLRNLIDGTEFQPVAH